MNESFKAPYVEMSEDHKEEEYWRTFALRFQLPKFLNNLNFSC